MMENKPKIRRNGDIKQALTVTGILAAIVLIPLIVTGVSIWHMFTQPRVQLENGGQIHITASQTFEIFLEDSFPPTLNSYDFTFINTENQDRINSYAPTIVSTYSIGSVIVNGVPVRGRFGKLVALVDLEPGSYIIEYSPWEGSGVFVWGFYTTGGMFLLVAGFSISVVVFIASTAAFIILSVGHRDAKRAEQWKERAYEHD